MKEVKVNNPILRGFHPDPSFIFVDGYYYIATSTFEYLPGVTIHFSKDLVHWDTIGAFQDKKHLDLTGIPASGGIWAPCLRYHKEEKLFYLLYTKFKSSYTPPFRDQDNYLVTAETVNGPWSEPIHLNASGYDPAIFFDVDGKAYVTNMIWDFRAEPTKMSAGIILQEYDWKKCRLVGEYKMIFEGTELGQTEGPNLFKKDGWYYLLTAEGGTSYGHTVTLARSRNVWGPYEVHPDKYILHTLGSESPLQKAGHASVCCNREGRWFMAYLCSRPLSNSRCNMGRETAVQEVEWKEDGWLYLKNGGKLPDLEFTMLTEDDTPHEEKRTIYTFENKAFLKDFMLLREPFNNGRFSLKDRPGVLRMYGRESMNSVIEQSVLVRRQTERDFSATVELEFEPQHYGTMAGILYRYNERHQFYCYMTKEEEFGYVVGCIGIDGFSYSTLERERQIKVQANHIYLKVEVHDIEGQFYCSEDNEGWKKVGDKFDASQLSDDYAIGFTASMVGMACQDLLYHKHPADFISFTYENLNGRSRK